MQITTKKKINKEPKIQISISKCIYNTYIFSTGHILSESFRFHPI